MSALHTIEDQVTLITKSFHTFASSVESTMKVFSKKLEIIESNMCRFDDSTTVKEKAEFTTEVKGNVSLLNVLGSSPAAAASVDAANLPSLKGLILQELFIRWHTDALHVFVPTSSNKSQYAQMKHCVNVMKSMMTDEEKQSIITNAPNTSSSSYIEWKRNFTLLSKRLEKRVMDKLIEHRDSISETGDVESHKKKRKRNWKALVSPCYKRLKKLHSFAVQ